MRKGISELLRKYIKLERILIFILVNFLLIANLIPYFVKYNRICQDSKIHSFNRFLKTSSSNGGGYIMNGNASYSWIEISSSGILMNISNENNDYETISLEAEGWNFTFYEIEYNNIFVSTNGWMSFTNLGDTHLKSSPIPNLNDENNDCVALLCTDLNPNYGGEIYYEFRSVPNNYLVIEYHNIYSEDNNFVGSFEVIFNQSGEIKFQYQNINYLSKYDAIVGLDHGDLTNYNSYSNINKNNLPFESKALEFTFNKMAEINYSLGIEVNEEYSWIVAEIDNILMDEIFGSNWEELYGIFPDPAKLSKFKINITSILENSTHWEVNYSIWNWTNKNNNFNLTNDGSDLLTFLKDPLDYITPHNLTHIFPFFIPTPIFHYLNGSNLLGSYSRISSYDSGGEYVKLGDTIMSSTTINGSIIQFGRNAYYNKKGLLNWMDFYYVNQSWEDSDKKSIFTLYNFYESLKPSFIGVNESDVYNYGIFYSERNAPIIPLRNYSRIPNTISFTVDFIGGCDPYFNHSLIITNNTEADLIINLFSAEEHPGIYYLPENLTRFTRLQQFIIPKAVNWTYLDFIRSDITSISNGYIISFSIMNVNFEFEYTYTSPGLLDTYSEYNNGKEYFTVRLNDFDYQIDDSDPIISIISPQSNQTFGRIAPNYNISIIEPNLDRIWYTIDGGLNNITITSLNGKINQTLWNNLSEGLVTISFYANDTMGYLSYKEVIVIKKYPLDDKNEQLIIIITFIIIIASVIGVSATSFHYYQKEQKGKIREIPPFLEMGEETYQHTLISSAKNILNNITNKELLLKLFDEEIYIDKKDIFEKSKLTTVSDEFLMKVDSLGLDEYEKTEFLREMLSLSPKEREEIISNIISKINLIKSPVQSSRDILNNLIDKNLLTQIFDENIPLKKNIQLEKIKLTVVSEKFLNKIDALGLEGDMKVKFIEEMLALSPKEREEIIHKILKRKNTYEL